MSHTPNQPDTGYTTGFYDGVKATEERIIKLLEAEQLHDPDITECHCGSWREAVTLIKGKSND